MSQSVIPQNVHSVMEQNYRVTSIASGVTHVSNVTLSAPSGYKILCVTRAVTNGWTATVSMPILSITEAEEKIDLWFNPATPNANCTVDIRYLVYN